MGMEEAEVRRRANIERVRLWNIANPGRHAAWVEANRDRVASKQAVWKAANRERIAGYNRKRRYGITETTYQELLERQNGICALCGRPETANGRKRLAVDHDHGTSKIRGLLCVGCNISLGYYQRGWRSRLDPNVVERYLGEG